ncbi:MAG: Eco57I restriction-modification methylase domain-containing protein [Proteobacteria bacterium]|nr:Eco57I restriction-modification methylase domain-containing protein [Pseudomonadota bacterium]
MNAQQRNELIKTRNFYKLFIEQGFDNPPSRNNNILLPRADSSKVTAELICQKRGFVICTCEINNNAEISKAEINKLLRELSKSHYENILIIYGKDSNGHEEQQWIVSIRPQNRPLLTVSVPWHENKSNQLLEEKLQGLIFPLEGEEELTISDVVQRVRSAFVANSEKITKKFYEKFKQQLNIFEEFIEGIENLIDKKQYAALMLNRLMFVYFIQKKGFLDGNINYLQERLEQVKKQYGNNQFHDKFYREFLRRLFKEGLDTPVEQRDSTISKLLGKVPYLNGGLFDAHRLETDNLKINLSDKAFENIFNFFGQYQWHLDSRPTAKGNEINPDVLGYIFEKYINDRAQMGAYYTQEDITEYIAKNTILPYLLQQAEKECRNAFTADSSIWRFLQENPDNYIYDAVKHGCNLSDDKIPENIRQGLDSTKADLLARRRDWNTTATEKFALPKETWREVIARRQHYCKVKEKISNGEIERVEDLITYNLDIVRFVADALKNYEGSDFTDVVFRTIAGVRDKWVTGTNSKVRRGISILDPSCGSGAFLFAALNILQPLYKICIERMEEFVATDDHRLQQKDGAKRYPLFRQVLKEVEEHPNQEYWIYKTIILENLYGVDLMAEAVEIAKLRLFLQLAAVAEYDENAVNLGLEPLPDIDYNIRAGNSLVGFANMTEFEDTLKGKLNFAPKLKEKIGQQAYTVSIKNIAFRQAQDDYQNINYSEVKQELTDELKKLNDELNNYLASAAYNIDSNKSSNKYQDWKKDTQPFHWLAEFYGIIEEKGGFDVVIGNPPYVAKRKLNYKLFGYLNNNPADIYATFIEKTAYLLNGIGKTGMIIPLSLGFSNSFSSYRELIIRHYSYNWYSSYGRIPAGLFNADVRIRNTIHIGSKILNTKTHCLYTTKLNRWYSEQRNSLFSTLQYANYASSVWGNKVPKSNSDKLLNAFENCLQKNGTIGDLLGDARNTVYPLFYKQSAYNWLTCAIEMPPCYIGKNIVSNSKLGQLNFTIQDNRNIAMLLLNGRLMFIFWVILGDDFDVTKNNLTEFPISLNKISPPKKVKLLSLYKELSEFLPQTIQYKLNAGKKIGTYNLAKCRHITDKSDVLFAEILGITDVWEEIELYYSQTIKSIDSYE